jgi:hypothetical protein
MVEQHSQHLPHAAYTMKVYRHVAAGRLQVAQDGDLPPDDLEVVQRPFDASSFRNGKNVKYRTAAASRGNIVLFCGLRNHVDLRGLAGGAEGIRTDAHRGRQAVAPASNGGAPGPH